MSERFHGPLYDLLDRIIEHVVTTDQRSFEVTPEEYHLLRDADSYEVEAYLVRNLPLSHFGQSIDLIIVSRPDLRTIPVTFNVDLSTGEVHEDPPTGVRHLPSASPGS